MVGVLCWLFFVCFFFFFLLLVGGGGGGGGGVRACVVCLTAPYLLLYQGTDF
eukprot:COSAG05_NODE_20275_length_281_cov_0.505495_1_plen_51_part_01